MTATLNVHDPAWEARVGAHPLPGAPLLGSRTIAEVLGLPAAPPGGGPHAARRPRRPAGRSARPAGIVGGHVPARPDTIRFVRERFVDDRGLVAVEYEKEDDRSLLMVFGITRTEADGWQLAGAAGGDRSEPRSSAPWANMGRWWNDRVACAGGRVHGAEVRKVRLAAAGGETVEDDIGESGIALLLAAGPFAQPWTVELHDADGGLVRRHPFHGGHPG